MPDKAAELVEQRRWILRPECSGLRMFDALLEVEFVSRDEHDAWQSRALARTVGFAAAAVPYYRRMFQRCGFAARDIRRPEDLAQLPILTKQDVIESGVDLRAERLPAGEYPWGPAESSGTTGCPVRVETTRGHQSMYTLLWHRQARWFRLDPAGSFCDIRYHRDIGRQADGSPHPDGAVRRWPHWRYLGPYFETGPEFGFNRSNDVEQKVAWLKELQPNYLMCDPGLMEELALAHGGRSPSDRLQALIAISSQMTDSLRQQLTRFYGVPIHQTYGLNEIGKVGLRCDAGRYHVHTEHCLVEIVDELGRPTPPGAVGRILVTAFRNPFMPLIRYDTGDLAQAVEGPCPCGRTLPSFGEIAGRYRRFAGLPDHTRDRVRVLQRAFARCPVEELLVVRQFQIHQHRDQHFELRLQTTGPIPESLRQHFLRAWSKAAIEPLVALELRRVDAVCRSPGGKVLDFTSDLYPDDAAAGPQRQTLSL
jgi:phenylacetate-CoA ligase